MDRDEWMRRSGPLYPGLVAACCLTRLPVPAGLAQPTAADVQRAAVWFPVVGGLLGAALAGVIAVGVGVGLVPAVAAALALMLEPVLTGGLHEAGVARVAGQVGQELRRGGTPDASGGSGGHGDVAVAGAVAVVAVLAVRGVGLLGVAAGAWVGALVVSRMVARWAVLVMDALDEKAPAQDGPGQVRASLRVGLVSWVPLAVGGGITAVVAIWLGGSTGLIAALAGTAVAALLARLVRGAGEHRLAAAAVLCEVTVLLIFAARVPAAISPWIHG